VRDAPAHPSDGPLGVRKATFMARSVLNVAFRTSRCTVWWAAPVGPETAPALVGLLDADERDRLARFRRPADRARYLAAHALARLVLAGDGTGAAAAALSFDRTCRCGAAHGKPVLPGGPGFSLSHAGDLVGVAVRPDGPVGLDVEQVRAVADLAALAEHVHSPAERARDVGLEVEAFFRIWTRKEALVKSTGDGLSTPMSEITLAERGTIVERWTGPGAPAGPVWLRDLAPAPDHPAAVAGPGDHPPEVFEADGNAVLRG
jgi:4'-phosphopantetheinyl transferase